jgi:hypothetical protein
MIEIIIINKIKEKVIGIYIMINNLVLIRGQINRDKVMINIGIISEINRIQYKLSHNLQINNKHNKIP